MKNIFITFLILMVVWVLLNNSVQIDILIPGLITAFIVSLLVCKQCEIFSDFKLTPKAFAYTIIFLFVFFIELIKSNIDVIKRVLTPSLPINPGIVEVKTTLKSKFARMLLANTITLTPGTLTVEVKDESFFIHWIDVKTEDAEKAGDEIIKKFEKYLEVIYG